jgi:hypothetical protein
MALISMTNDELRLELTRSEKLAALHGDVRVPRSAVRDIRVDDDPLGAVRGLRAPGLGLPGSKKIGTWRGRGHRQFVVARQGMPAVRVRLEGTTFDELIVSTPDAEAVAADARRR